jgi:hypothetical protein
MPASHLAYRQHQHQQRQRQPVLSIHPAAAVVVLLLSHLAAGLLVMGERQQVVLCSGQRQ